MKAHPTFPYCYETDATQFLSRRNSESGKLRCCLLPILSLKYLLQGKSYEQRLRALNLTTLETRRLRGDLIEVFKIMNGFDKVGSLETLLCFSTSNLRGNTKKLYKPRFSTNIGKFTFANRIVDEWNMLSEEVVSCSTVLLFKIKLDRYLKNCRGLI